MHRCLGPSILQRNHESVHPANRRPADLESRVLRQHEVTRIRARFLTAGQHVWHCHILEHEDNEMMRPYRIGPVQPGQPT
ncbi:multicopper oxidase domain-containing protein [Sorangium sp. So ce367]